MVRPTTKWSRAARGSATSTTSTTTTLPHRQIVSRVGPDCEKEQGECSRTLIVKVLCCRQHPLLCGCHDICYSIVIVIYVMYAMPKDDKSFPVLYIDLILFVKTVFEEQFF